MRAPFWPGPPRALLRESTGGERRGSVGLVLPPLIRTETSHGLLVAFALPAAHDPLGQALWAGVPEAERGLAARFAPRRRMTFAGGRYALRAALAGVGCPDAGPILHTPRGAPAVPAGYLGSISHKDTVACAIAEARGAGFIGVDVEVVGLPSAKIMHLVLTDREMAHVRSLDGEAGLLDLALRWSLKEALYKALDPYVGRYVGFQEVEAWPGPDGGARLELALVKEADRGASFAVDGRWLREGDLVYALVRVTRPEGSAPPR